MYNRCVTILLRQSLSIATSVTKTLDHNSAPIYNYSVQDTMTVHHFWLCLYEVIS